MQDEYFIVVEGRQEGPFPFDALKYKNLSPDTLVWKQGLPDWVKASEIPELLPLLTITVDAEEVEPEEERGWFAMMGGTRIGPNSISELIGMGLKPTTPVWHNGMADWALANTQPTIMRRLNATPPQNPFAANPQYGNPRQNYNPRQSYGNNPDFGANPQYGSHENNGYNPNFQRNPYGQPANRTNWLPWAIAATVAGFLFSCIGCIFGIIGLIYANKANNFYSAGYDEDGDRANNTARIMTIIGIITAGIGLIFSGYLLSTGNLFTGIL